FFDLVTVGTASSVAHEKISDDPLALLINKEGVAKNAAPLDGGVAGENLGVHVAQDHLGGGSVVPREQASPHGDLIFQQRSKIGGREMSEIENFHKKSLRSQPSGLRRSARFRCQFGVWCLRPDT